MNSWFVKVYRWWCVFSIKLFSENYITESASVRPQTDVFSSSLEFKLRIRNKANLFTQLTRTNHCVVCFQIDASFECSQCGLGELCESIRLRILFLATAVALPTMQDTTKLTPKKKFKLQT